MTVYESLLGAIQVLADFLGEAARDATTDGPGPKSTCAVLTIVNDINDLAKVLADMNERVATTATSMDASRAVPAADGDLEKQTRVICEALEQRLRDDLEKEGDRLLRENYA